MNLILNLTVDFNDLMVLEDSYRTHTHTHTLLEVLSFSQESELVYPAMYQELLKWKLNKLHSSVAKQRLALCHYVS